MNTINLLRQKLLFAILMLMLFFTACQQNNTAIIKGDIKGLDTKMMYLARAYPMDSPPFDSARVTNGKFEFNIHSDTILEPDLVVLNYINSKGIQNSVTITHKKAKVISNIPMGYSAFVMEPGVTNLKGDLSGKHGRAMLTLGPQNDLYFSHYDLPYIEISPDSTRRKAQAARINKLIKKTPDAFYLLEAMDNFRMSFEHKYLLDFYNSFGNAVKKSYKGRRFKQFIDDQPPGKDIFLQSHFIDVNNKSLPVLDSTKKLNIVVFWASWCGPCRREIPSLKKVYNQIPAKDVRIVSVSVDDSKTDWETAMAQEKMPWQQLLIQPAEKNRADARYNLGFIPQIYIVDQHNKVVKKINGFEEGGDKEIMDFIDQYLAKS